MTQFRKFYEILLSIFLSLFSVQRILKEEKVSIFLLQKSWHSFELMRALGASFQTLILCTFFSPSVCTVSRSKPRTQKSKKNYACASHQVFIMVEFQLFSIITFDDFRRFEPLPNFENFGVYLDSFPLVFCTKQRKQITKILGSEG